MRQRRGGVCSVGLGLLVVLLPCTICYLVWWAGASKLLSDVSRHPTWQLFFSTPAPESPEYPAMTGLVYIIPTQAECTTLKSKAHLGLALPGLFDMDYTVCYGLPVEIVEADWIQRASSGCYVYHVRVPGTLNMAGWIYQDELGQSLDAPAPACPAKEP